MKESIKLNKFLATDYFESPFGDAIKWRLRIQNDPNLNYIRIGLAWKSINPVKIRYKCDIPQLKIDGQWMEDNVSLKPACWMDFAISRLSKSKLSKFKQGKQLTIVMNIEYVQFEFEFTARVLSAASNYAKSTIDVESNDFLLFTNRKTISVLKSLLANRWPYFKRRFCSNFGQQFFDNRTSNANCHSNCWKIDVDHRTGQNLTNYLYTGFINYDNIGQLIQLSKVAGTFELSQLKLETEQQLTNSVNDQSVFEILIFAHEFNRSDLYNYSLNYIKSSPTKLEDLPNYTKLNNYKNATKLLVQLCDETMSESRSFKSINTINKL